MFKNVIFKFAAALLVAAFAVGETCADEGSAPINPAFLKWRKDRNSKPVKPVSDGRKSRKLLASAPQTAEGELGLAPSVFDSSYLANLNISRVRGVGASYPSKYDLREQGWLTPIRDQNPYGTCWTFATYSSMESSLLKFEGQAFDFSENNLANLHGGDWGYDDGGNADLASAYLLRWDGPVLESSDSYPNPGGSRVLSPVFHVQNVPWVAGKTTYLDNDDIKDAIMKYGALWVGYYHDGSCYDSAKSSYYFPYFFADGRRHVNHAVAVVGWDDDYSKYNFVDTPPGNGAYIVRNNWGSYWGDGGYFYVSYFDETFAWNTLYSFSNVEAVDNYSVIYQYDPLGLVNSIGFGGSSAWGANMFKATTSDPISAVGFYAMTPRTAYKIFIYTGCTTGNPCSGTLKLTQSGMSETAGYLTVPLSQSVGITKDVMFSVVLQLTTSGYNYPLAFEYAVDGYSSGATASRGQSYVSNGGEVWTDFADTPRYPYANFCCKAYAKAKAAPVKVLASIGVEGVASLTSGKSAQFTCKVKYSDGSEADVTDRATWSIADGRSYASVSSSGLVTAKASSGSNVIRVHAEYTEDNVTVGSNPDWGFYVTAVAPNAPIDLEATQGDDASCVRLTWTAPEGATEFKVYRGATADSKNAKFMDTVTMGSKNMKYSDTSEDVVPGVDYYYFVKAKNNSGTSDFSNGASGYRKLAPPEVRASDGTCLNGVQLQWGEVAGAAYYRVYRADDPEESAEKKAISGWIPQTEYLDDTAEAGVTYYYYVVAAVDNRGRRPSDYSIIEDGYRGVPVVPVGLEIIGESSIPSGGNRTYTCTVIKSDDTREENVAATWSLATTKAARLSGSKIYAYDVTENTKVVLTAAYGSLRQNLEVTITAVKPDPPTSLTLLSANEKGVYFQWAPVLGAAGYKIYRHDGTTETVIAEINDGEAYKYTDKTAVPGVKYTYRISSLNSAGEGDKSSKSLEVTIGLAAPTGVMATSDDSAQVTVSWQKVAGATYYRVYRAESQTGTKTALGSWQTAFTYPDKGGTAGKKYYYFVCGATTSMGANAGPFSEGVTGKRPVAVTLSSIAITGGGTKVASGGKMTLSCLATYSDNTEKSVTPTWNVSPTTYATIDAAGQFSAKSVTADQKVTVTASFGGKTDAREIKIIAPVVATAKVSNVKATPRWPFSNLLDVDYELQTTPEGTRAAIALSGYDNDRRVAMAAHTLSGDGADGSVAAGKRRLTWDVAVDYPDFRSSSLDVELTAVAITVAAPTDLTASSGTSSGGVNLSWTGVEDVTEYEIWRGTSSVSSAAAKIRSVAATSYLDSAAVAGTTYYYWVKAVSPDGISDFSKAVSGSRPYANVVIKFNGNGGTASASQLTLTPGTAYGTLPTATRTGHTFDGWYTAASGGTKIIATSIVPTAATELFAHWKANTYTVTLNKNGGTCADLTSYTYGVGATLPTPTRASYTFGGWFTTSACTGTAVTKISTTDTGNKVFYAKWTPNTYTVTLNKNGGTCADLTSYTYGIGATLPTPTKAGNTFGGWFTTSACTGTAVTKISTTDTGNKVFYAKWTGISYTIAFNANGGSGTMSNLSMVYGTAKNLTANSFTRRGYEFQGWATSSTGSVVYGNGVSVNNLTQSSGATIVLYAVWERVFDLMPLRSLLYYISSADNIISEKEMLLALKNPTICPFDNDTKYISDREMALLLQISELNQNSNLVSNVIQRNYENITEATMERLQELSDEIKYFDYTPSGNVCIAYDANGGLGNMQMVVIPRGGSVTLSGNQFYGVSDGIFAGWATSPTGEVVYQDGERIDDVDSSKVLYAVWLGTPVLTKTITGNGTLLSWEPVHGAKKYVILHASPPSDVTGNTLIMWNSLVRGNLNIAATKYDVETGNSGYVLATITDCSYLSEDTRGYFIVLALNGSAKTISNMQ